MNRRSFISSLLAACAAPAIVRAESLMPCRGVLVPGYGARSVVWVDSAGLMPGSLGSIRAAILYAERTGRESVCIAGWHIESDIGRVVVDRQMTLEWRTAGIQFGRPPDKLNLIPGDSITIADR